MASPWCQLMVASIWPQLFNWSISMWEVNQKKPGCSVYKGDYTAQIKELQWASTRTLVLTKPVELDVKRFVFPPFLMWFCWLTGTLLPRSVSKPNNPVLRWIMSIRRKYIPLLFVIRRIWLSCSSSETEMEATFYLNIYFIAKHTYCTSATNNCVWHEGRRHGFFEPVSVDWLWPSLSREANFEVFGASLEWCSLEHPIRTELREVT